jgi:hypothetical protein
MATLSARLASIGALPAELFFPGTTSTDDASFTGVPADGFPFATKSACPPGFGFHIGSLSGGCAVNDSAVAAFGLALLPPASFTDTDGDDADGDDPDEGAAEDEEDIGAAACALPSSSEPRHGSQITSASKASTPTPMPPITNGRDR